MGIRSSEETRVYEKSRSDVMASLVRAMEALKLKIEQRDDAAGRISASQGLNLLSTGTKLDVQVSERDGQTTVAVSAETRSKLTLVDYGQSGRNIKNLLNKTEEFLGVSGQPQTASAAPATEVAGTVTICPGCNNAMAESAKFCTSCGAKLTADTV